MTDYRPKSIDELQHQFLTEHHEHYVALNRLVISLASGGLALIAALWQVEPDEALLATAFALLLVSVCAGTLLAFRNMMRPFEDAEKLRVLAKENEGSEQPMVFRRTPAKRDGAYMKTQLATFAIAIFAIGAATLY